MKKRHPEYQYLDLVREILEEGSEKREHNTGITLRGVFGRQIRFDMADGFPLLTTKKVFLRGIIHELLWFLRGDSNIKYLVDNNVHIWDEWAYKIYKMKNEKLKIKSLTQEQFIQKIAEDKKFAQKWGELGPVYGRQWRKWKTSDGREVDQLKWVISKLKSSDPFRKHFVVSAWNPEYIYEMARPGKAMVLPPCHTLFHLNVRDNKLSLQLYQRSADLFLGVPFNIASYSLLLMMIAQVTGFKVGEFVHTFGDVHLYGNHFDQAREQISRVPRPFPRMILNPKIKNIDGFKLEDFTLVNYNPHPPIKAPITVVGGA